MESKRKSKPSALAQLCALLMERGISTAKALAEHTGYSERQIWRARAELAANVTDAGDTDADVTMTQTTLTPMSVSVTPMSVRPDADVSVEPRVYARKESPSGILIPKKLDTPFIPQDPYAQVWRDENGRLVLSDEYRADWITRFGGDAARLDLAITQAEGYLQPNNRTKSLDVQLASQLARIVAEKRDRDTRYASAAAANQPAKANGQPSATLAAMDRIKARMAAGASA